MTVKAKDPLQSRSLHQNGRNAVGERHPLIRELSHQDQRLGPVLFARTEPLNARIHGVLPPLRCKSVMAPPGNQCYGLAEDMCRRNEPIPALSHLAPGLPRDRVKLIPGDFEGVAQNQGVHCVAERELADSPAEPATLTHIVPCPYPAPCAMAHS